MSVIDRSFAEQPIAERSTAERLSAERLSAERLSKQESRLSVALAGVDRARGFVPCRDKHAMLLQALSFATTERYSNGDPTTASCGESVWHKLNRKNA